MTIEHPLFPVCGPEKQELEEDSQPSDGAQESKQDSSGGKMAK